MSQVSTSVIRVRERVEAACARSGRDSSEVTLIAAGKTRSPAEMLAAFRAGITHFGENYVQEMLAKRAVIDKEAGSSVTWHLIGHLQRNKVKHAIPGMALIHSVDSVGLAQEIEKRAAAVSSRQPVLLEVKVAAEDSKFGLSPAEVAATAEVVASLPHLELQGLMTMPPYSPNAEESRPHFRQLAQLLVQLKDQGLLSAPVQHLSMGMSGDFEVAIEEGATLIRLGTVLFGPRSGG
jgi:PLP dependent protein